MKLYKFPARPEQPMAFAGNLFGQRIGQHHKRNPGNEIINGFNSPLGQVPGDMFCRIVNKCNPGVVNGLPELFDENIINFKNQNLCIRSQAIQDVSGNRAVARPEFNNNIGLIGIDLSGNSPAQKPRAPGNTARGFQISETLPEKIEAFAQSLSF